MNPVQVRFTLTGKPLAVRYQDRIWAVAAEPVRWFQRRDWWNQVTSAAKGVGNIVDIEYWRVQVRLTPTSSLRTFTLYRKASSTQWILETITDL